MGHVCILTDNTVQFARSNFSGQEFTRVFSFEARHAPDRAEVGSAPSEIRRRLAHPYVRGIQEYFIKLDREFESVVFITIASSLNPAVLWIQEAASLHVSHAKIVVVDSRTTSVGLGFLVQAAAKAAASGAKLDEVEHLVRIYSAHIYTLFCIPRLIYLISMGHLSHAQAVVGEMMGLLSIFAIEDGHLTPIQKVRTQRHLIESFEEFMDEFSDPQHVALVKGAESNMKARPLREYVSELFPQTSFSEHAMGSYLTSLVGPQSIGLFIIDKVDL